MTIPKRVEVVEVGPRDGLQNENTFVSTEDKVELIQRLTACGLKTVEATSFVSSKWIPQFKDSKQTLEDLLKKPSKFADVSYPVLVPNIKGLERALAAGATSVAVFTAVSETFSRKNTNCSIEESLLRIDEIFSHLDGSQIRVRAYISCVIACPYEGMIPIEKTVKMARHLHSKGAYQISLGDTIGVATPLISQKLVDEVAKVVPIENLAVHFHDTYGQALANILATLERGVRAVDTSIAGLGGCPYAKGASGNVATEDVVYMLQGMGIETGVDLNSLINTASFVQRLIPSHIGSKVYKALTNK